MDLYSSLRVLRKWWYVAAVVLVLTAFGAVASVAQVSDSEQASGEVVLLAAPTPPAATNDNPNPPEANNPYALMALPDIVDVISRSVSSDSTGRSLELQGLSGSYTIAGNQEFQRGPIITIEVTSPNEEAALDSYALVADEVESTLDRLQDEVGANPAFRVKMQRLTAPQLTSSGTLAGLRAGVIALAIGFLLSLAVVFGVESISRGRARWAQRRAAEASTTGSGQASGNVSSERLDDPRDAPAPARAGLVDGGVASNGEGIAEEPATRSRTRGIPAKISKGTKAPRRRNPNGSRQRNDRASEPTPKTTNTARNDDLHQETAGTTEASDNSEADAVPSEEL
jgi:hypothetical protein